MWDARRRPWGATFLGTSSAGASAFCGWPPGPSRATPEEPHWCPRQATRQPGGREAGSPDLLRADNGDVMGGCKLRAHRPERVMQSGGDRPDRDAEDIGYLGTGQARVVRQDDDRAVIEAEAIERAIERIAVHHP